MAGDFLRIFFTVLIVMDPIGVIPMFLSVTSRYDAKTKKHIILHAVLIAGFVLMVFLVAGKFLLAFFGIMPGAFYISGGILFFIIAFGMISPRPEMTRDVSPEDKTGVSVALFPLAIPFIAGPGLLTVIVMFVNSSESWLYSVALLVPAIALSLIVEFITMRCSALLLKFFGSMGISIMEKIMGLILAGFSVQFIYEGFVALNIIHP